MINEPTGETVSSDDDDAPTSRYKVLSGKSEVVVVEKRGRGESADGQESTRLEVRLVVSIESESNFYVGFTENLSEGGVFVATYAPRRIGCTVDLVIELPHQAPIQAKGTVRWVRAYSEESSDTVPGMGICFDQLSADDANRIRGFTQSRQPMFFDDEALGVVGLPAVRATAGV